MSNQAEPVWVWRVGPVRRDDALFVELPNLVPIGSVLHFTCGSRRLWKVLTGRLVGKPEGSDPAWKMHDTHLVVEPGHMGLLQDQCQQLPWPELAESIHVTKGDARVLDWFDTGSDNPITLSGDLDASLVAGFADALGGRSERILASHFPGSGALPI